MSFPQRYAYGKVRTRQADDDWDYFPYGWLGRGYRVDAMELARFIALEHSWSQVAIFAMAWAVATVLFAACQIEPRLVVLAGVAVAGMITVAWFVLVVSRRTRWLAPAERPLTWTELRRWEAPVLSRWRLLLLFVAAMGLTTLGVLLMVRAAPDPELDRVVLGTSLGFLCLVIGCYGFAKLTCTSWFRFSVGRRNSVG